MRGGVSCCGCGSSRGYNKEKALLLFKEQAMIASSFFGAGGGGFLPKEFLSISGQKRMSSSSSSSSCGKGVLFPTLTTRDRKTGFAALRGGGRTTTTLFSSARRVFASTDKGGEKKDDWSSSLPQNAHAIVAAFANSIENATEASKILEDLSGKILENDRLYYDEAKEKISDSDYDMLRMKFEAVEKRFEALKGKYGDGLDTRVGSGKASSSSSSSPSSSRESGSFEYKKYKHLSPMKSLKNAFTEKEMREFDERVMKSLTDDNDDDDDTFNNNTSTIRGNLEYCAELKIDGVSASLRYENGKLVRALSRGDGEFGDDITRHVMSSMCPDVPRELEGEG